MAIFNSYVKLPEGSWVFRIRCSRFCMEFVGMVQGHHGEKAMFEVHGSP